MCLATAACLNNDKLVVLNYAYVKRMIIVRRVDHGNTMYFMCFFLLNSHKYLLGVPLRCLVLCYPDKFLPELVSDNNPNNGSKEEHRYMRLDARRYIHHYRLLASTSRQSYSFRLNFS